MARAAAAGIIAPDIADAVLQGQIKEFPWQEVYQRFISRVMEMARAEARRSPEEG
jgi:hypothetical protein